MCGVSLCCGVTLVGAVSTSAGEQLRHASTKTNQPNEAGGRLVGDLQKTTKNRRGRSLDAPFTRHVGRSCQ